MARYGMVIDLGSCVGCRGCVEACKVENNTTQGTFWMHVFRFEEGTFPNTRIWFMPRPCMHCDNAPCVKVCPVGARYKRADGIVATDWERCIGCRYCEVACPYGVNYSNWGHPSERRYFDWDDLDLQAVTNGVVPPFKNPDLALPHGPEQRHIAGAAPSEGVMEKCTFCVQRVEKGMDPACVTTCPVEAITFGDLSDSSSDVARKLRDHESFRLLEDVGTHPRVYYIRGSPPGHGIRQIEPLRRRG